MHMLVGQSQFGTYTSSEQQTATESSLVGLASSHARNGGAYFSTVHGCTTDLIVGQGLSGHLE